MVAPIITLLLAGAVAFRAFKTSTVPTGMENAGAPALVEAPAADEPVDEEPAEESE